jgi:hypothetical protein
MNGVGSFRQALLVLSLLILLTGSVFTLAEAQGVPSEKGSETTVRVTEREDYILVGQAFVVEGKVKNVGKKTATQVVIFVSCPATPEAKKVVRCTPDIESQAVIASLEPGETKEFRIEAAVWYPERGKGQTSRAAIRGYTPDSPIMGFFNPIVQVVHK